MKKEVLSSDCELDRRAVIKWTAMTTLLAAMGSGCAQTTENRDSPTADDLSLASAEYGVFFQYYMMTSAEKGAFANFSEFNSVEIDQMDRFANLTSEKIDRFMSAEFSTLPSAEQSAYLAFADLDSAELQMLVESDISPLEPNAVNDRSDGLADLPGKAFLSSPELESLSRLRLLDDPRANEFREMLGMTEQEYENLLGASATLLSGAEKIIGDEFQLIEGPEKIHISELAGINSPELARLNSLTWGLDLEAEKTRAIPYLAE